jgi:hypothetical protein
MTEKIFIDSQVGFIPRSLLLLRNNVTEIEEMNNEQ